MDDRPVSALPAGPWDGDVAAARGNPLHELTPRTGSLEEAYLALTEGSVQYKTKEIA